MHVSVATVPTLLLLIEGIEDMYVHYMGLGVGDSQRRLEAKASTRFAAYER